MDNIKRDKILNLIQSDSINATDFIWLIDQRTLDEDRGTVEWSKIAPHHLNMMFKSNYFHEAFLNVRYYFEAKWHITKLKLPDKTLYIDSELGNIYGR